MYFCELCLDFVWRQSELCVFRCVVSAAHLFVFCKNLQYIAIIKPLVKFANFTSTVTARVIIACQIIDGRVDNEKRHKSDNNHRRGACRMFAVHNNTGGNNNNFIIYAKERIY